MGPQPVRALETRPHFVFACLAWLAVNGSGRCRSLVPRQLVIQLGAGVGSGALGGGLGQAQDFAGFDEAQAHEQAQHP